MPWSSPDDGDEDGPAALLVIRQADLEILRETLQRFAKDTGCYPNSLSDLVADESPVCGQYYGKPVKIDPKNWKGPYVDFVSCDPVSGKPYVYLSDAEQ